MRLGRVKAESMSTYTGRNIVSAREAGEGSERKRKRKRNEHSVAPKYFKFPNAARTRPSRSAVMYFPWIPSSNDRPSPVVLQHQQKSKISFASKEKGQGRDRAHLKLQNESNLVGNPASFKSS